MSAPAEIQRRFPTWTPQQCTSYAATRTDYEDALEALPTQERMPQRTNRHPNAKQRNDTHRKAYGRPGKD